MAPICDDCYEGGVTEPADPEFSTARTEPENETGQAGVDLGSRNFNWRTTLVSMPGRAGLDLNLSLVYNSLVWTKQHTSVQYNADHGFPGPGFRLSFPSVQERYFDYVTNAYAYAMITPAGGAQSYRQVMQLEHNTLQDVSDDGRRLLFYQTGEPTRVSSAARPAGEAQQPGDVLRVVEREGGARSRASRSTSSPRERSSSPARRWSSTKSLRATGYSTGSRRGTSRPASRRRAPTPTP